MLSDWIAETILVLSIAAVAYHHIGYPILLRHLAQVAAGRVRQVPTSGEASRERLPSIAIIVPAHNEQHVIGEKIENLARLQYPTDRLSIVIALDGCSDATKAVAEAAIARAGRERSIRLVDYTVNRGKIAVLNEQIAAVEADIVALNDASGMIDAEALQRAARHFMDQDIGVVCATYRLPKAGSEGEAKYWEMQTQIKAYEAMIAAPMGAHGALYFFRRALWKPLPADTINDDFVLPMQIVAAGYKSIYDQSIVATERDVTANTQEFRRRVRIGAGNMQQLVRLIGLANPRLPGLAFVFLSGKGLRPVIPFLIVLAVLSTAVLAMKGDVAFQILLAAELIGFAFAGAIIYFDGARKSRLLAWLSYLVVGHTASAVGAVAFLTGNWRGPWKPANAGGLVAERVTDQSFIEAGGVAGAGAGAGSSSIDPPSPECEDAIPTSVAVGKRIFDIVAASFGLVLLAIVWVPVAIAIKRESPGPVLFRQQRVGRSTREATYLFDVYKFRSMCPDAEKTSGPVFAKKGDHRITKIGHLLRGTRIDELPQFINVLRGDMSMIGPRPERPVFVRELSESIPFYPERTMGLRPGMTGLAQVKQTYEESVKNVPMKVAYDHAYAMRLQRSARSWIATDLEILWRTLVVVFKRTGQ